MEDTYAELEVSTIDDDILEETHGILIIKVGIYIF